MQTAVKASKSAVPVKPDDLRARGLEEFKQADHLAITDHRKYQPR
jgi:hypothetical protein